MEKNMKKNETLYCIAEINTKLKINYTLTQKKKKRNKLQVNMFVITWTRVQHNNINKG